MDQLNYILFSEYEREKIKREINGAVSVYRHDLLRIINVYAETKETTIKNIE